jgi:hypothetical protein
MGRRPAKTIKLPFRKLNSLSSQQRQRARSKPSIYVARFRQARGLEHRINAIARNRDTNRAPRTAVASKAMLPCKNKRRVRRAPAAEAEFGNRGRSAAIAAHRHPVASLRLVLTLSGIQAIEIFFMHPTRAKCSIESNRGSHE